MGLDLHNSRSLGFLFHSNILVEAKISIEDKEMLSQTRQYFLTSTSALLLVTLFFVLTGYSFEKSAILIIVYSVVLRFPHFFATYMILSSVPRWREWFLDRPWQRIWIPGGILLLYAAPYDLFQLEPFRDLLDKVAYIWGFQHISFQAFGIARGYQNGRQYRWLVQLPFLCLFIQVATARAGFFDLETLQTIGVICNAGLVGSVITLLSLKTLGPRFYFYLITAVIFIFPWSFYHSRFEYFLVYNAHHSLNYLETGYGIIRKRFFTGDSFQGLKVYGVLFALSLVLITIHLMTNSNLVTDTGPIQGFFVLHYYFEAFVWRDTQLQLRALAA